MNKTIPAVSIVIPMYNTEKYIGECLDSILNQTFQDFEVILVDDCSTDNSCAIVESYKPKFGGKLQLIKSEKNSGGCAIPRNIGARYSIGKYLYFMDSDDVITETSLEELYHLAEDFNVDVVHCQKWYEAPEEFTADEKKSFKTNSWEMGEFVSKPVYLTDKLDERIKMFVEHKICWMAWLNLIRREYFLNFNRTFDDLRVSEDVLYMLKTLCTASKILCVPNIVYMWRTRKNSQCREVLPVEKRVPRRVRDVFLGITYLDEYMSGIEFFVKHPNYKYDVLNFFKELQTYDVLHMYARFPVHKLDGLIRRELDEVSDKTALTAFLFSRMNIFNLQVNVQNELIRKMETYIKKQALISQQRDSELESVQNYISELQAEIHRLKEKLTNSRSNH